MKLNMKKKTWKNIVQYAILIIVGIIMVYPLVWMCFAVFKTNAEIFSSAAIFPKKWVFDAFDGLGKPVGGQITLWKSMLNTYMMKEGIGLKEGGFHTDFLCIDRI